MPDTVNNTGKLREWLRECPAVSKKNRFHADYLGDEPTEYSILSSPSALRSHENILGETVLDDIQMQNFIIASREPYGADVAQNLENLLFYQGVTQWIVEKNNAGEFPEWEGGKVTSILPTLSAYPMQGGSTAAKYQIQIQVTYRRN